MKSAISIKKLNKSFGGVEILRDFDIDIAEGKITAIFGPNGSGKSTVLNILAGLVPKDSGECSMKNGDKFKISYIFQNYRESLLPWRNNFENLAFPLEIQGVSKAEITKRIERLQKLFELKIDWKQFPYQLSGGQQQILAFMRALITEPTILFIDEPFSALDYENNLKLREHLQKYYLAYKPTILLVTHNIEEAVHLADKIVIFSRKPTSVIDTISSTLVYPRDIKSLKTEEFHKIKDMVLSAFQRSVSL
jgi:NitT/TauT family transport system ATP-binding protein